MRDEGEKQKCDIIFLAQGLVLTVRPIEIMTSYL